MLSDASGLLSKIGNTPSIPLRIQRGRGMRLLAKLEWFNPFGSVKDRAAYWMIKDAIERGLLRDKVVIEPTSGNTGIALAGVAGLLGFEVEIVVPERFGASTMGILTSLGARVIRAKEQDHPELKSGTDKAIALALDMIKDQPRKYLMPNQFENEANFRAHYESTGPEVWSATDGKVTHLIVGSGTGGTITGVGQYIKERKPTVKIYGVQPQQGHHLQGLRNLNESKLPGVLGRRITLVDEWVEVSDEEAFQVVRDVAKEENLLVGPSSGGVLHAAYSLCEREGEGTAMAILADDGRKFRQLYTQFQVFTEHEFDGLTSSARLLPRLAYEVP